MFSDCARRAILAIACTDDKATTNDKDRLQAVLDGVPNRRVVSFAEAAKMLGLSLQVVRRMADKRILKPVTTGGERAYGVTDESIDDYINHGMTEVS